jgi:hypothetical protein
MPPVPAQAARYFQIRARRSHGGHGEEDEEGEEGFPLACCGAPEGDELAQRRGTV